MPWEKVLVLEKQIISWFLVTSADTVTATQSTALIPIEQKFDFQHDSQEKPSSFQTTSIFLFSTCQ